MVSATDAPQAHVSARTFSEPSREANGRPSAQPTPAAKYLAACRFHEMGDTIAQAPRIDSRTIRRFAMIQASTRNTRGALLKPVNQLPPGSSPQAREAAKDQYALLMAKRIWAKGDLQKNYLLSKMLQLANCAENGMSTLLNLARDLRAGAGSRDRAEIELMHCENDHAFTRVKFPWDGQAVIADAWTDDPPIFEQHLNAEFQEGLSVDFTLTNIHEKNAALRKVTNTEKAIKSRQDSIQEKLQTQYEQVRADPKAVKAMFFY